MPQVDFMTFYPLFYIFAIATITLFFFMTKNTFFNWTMYQKKNNSIYNKMVIDLMMYSQMNTYNNYPVEAEWLEILK